MNKIYQEVEKIINTVYAVGGCVRDKFLGKEPKDYDFTTSLSPEEIEKAIKKAGRHAYLTGKRFGTLGVKIDGQLIEITTFRSEKYKAGSRKPQVIFVKDITADLSRRDFTINAMAFRGKDYVIHDMIARKYKLIDPFNGKEDLEKRIIRCVGKPNERFKEDPLRMLRAGRFASQLDFTIDEDLEKKAKQLSYKILEVSKERWMMELDKLLVTKQPSIGLRFLANTRLLNYMIPELALQVGYDQNNLYHAFPLWTHTLWVVDSCLNDIELRWGALLHDIAKPFMRTDREDRSNYIHHDLVGKEMVEKLAYYLKWSNQRRKNVANLVLHHLREDSPLREADNLSKKEI